MKSTSQAELATAEPRGTQNSMNSSSPRRSKSCRQANAAARRNKTARINLGLELLRTRSVPGAQKQYHEIAAWCDCDERLIRHIELSALRKVRRKLAKSLTPKEMERCERFFVNNPIPAPPLADRWPARAPLVESWSVDERELPA